MEAELRIAAALSRRPFSPITTHQLAKLVGRSYSFTYTAVQRMAKAGMIQQEIVGHATLCSLMLAHPEVQALLSLHAVRQLKGKQPDRSLHVAVFTSKGKRFVLGYPGMKAKSALLPEDARQWLPTIDFATLEIESGAAYFWAVVGDAHA